MTTKTTAPDDSFFCQECGHRFRTVRVAEKAAWGDNGCPTCGGSDIDMGSPIRYENSNGETEGEALL